MNISEVNDTLDHISLPQDQRKAIIQLMDVKINNDMKDVIAEIRRLENKIQVSTEMLQEKMQMNQEKMQMNVDKLQMTQEKHSNEIRIVYWVIGIAMSIILFVVARK